MSASKDFFRLDPPQTFAYTDFVIRAPLPRIPWGMTEEAAEIKYPRTRLKRLIRVLEARLGRNRCFFAERQPKDKKKVTQLVVTKLYALYEVEKWPGALGQYDWTQFVIANMERDAVRDRYGPDAKLALPMLPLSAVPIYQEMMRQESPQWARFAGKPGQTNGLAMQGKTYLYAAEDPRRHELHDRSTEQTTTSQAMHGNIFNLTSAQLQKCIHNDQEYQELCRFHQAFVQKEYKTLYRCFMRVVGRKPGMHLKTWDEVLQEAREQIRGRLTGQLTQWRQRQPDVQHDFSRGSGAILDAQLSYFISCSRHNNPILAGASLQAQKELDRKHYIVAMERQRKVLRNWTAEVATRANMHEGERYRKEGEHIIDMWTGNVEDYETFNERNRKEHVGLTADMLPAAALARVREQQVQEETQTQARDQLQAQATDHTTQGLVPVHDQKPPPDDAQLLVQMQDQDHAQLQAHGQEQMEVDGDEQLQVDSQEKTQGQSISYLQTHSQDQMQGQSQEQTQAQERDKERADAGKLGPMETLIAEPMQLPDCMDLDVPLHGDSPKSMQAQFQEQVQSLPQAPTQAQAWEQFQAHVQVAAQADAQEMVQAQTVTPTQLQDHAPVEVVVHEQMPKQSGEPQPQAESSKEMPAQEQALLQAHEFVQVQAQLPSSMPVEEHAEAQFKEQMQAQPEQSTLADPHEPLQRQAHAITEARAQEQSHERVQLQIQEQAPMEATQQEEAQEQTRTDGQQTVEAELRKELQLEAQKQNETPVQDQGYIQDSTQVERQEPSHTEGSVAPDDDEEMDRSPEPSAGTIERRHSEYTSAESLSSNADERGDEKVAPSDPGTICHHCTNSKTRCNGERPCQFCIRYGKNCYDVGAQGPRRKTKASNLKKKNALTGEMGMGPDQDHGQMQTRAQPAASNQAQARALVQAQEPPSQLPEDSEMEPSEQDLIEVHVQLTKPEHFEGEPERPEHGNTMDSRDQIQAKAPKLPKQAPKQSNCNVTTRLAEQKASVDARRSLRPLPHRNAPKKA